MTFGIDVRWGGGEGNRRATVVRNLLTDAGIKAKLAHSMDGRAWELRGTCAGSGGGPGDRPVHLVAVEPG